MSRVPREPNCVDLNIVASMLDGIGWHQSASMVRRACTSDAEHYREVQHLNRRYTEVLARLEQYEPTPVPRTYDPTPPPEASD